MRFFEDILPGSVTKLGSYSFTAEAIKAYACRFDPQPFHIDEQAAAASHFGGLCASGWHTASICMKLMVAHRQRAFEQAVADGSRVAPLGPSPGFDNLRWPKPVYAGDTVAFSSRVEAKRILKSRPEWGLVSHYNEGINQNGELVFSFTGHVLVPLKSA